MKIEVAEGSFDVYVARPPIEPAPVVVVIQEIFGVNADLRATCDELAADGFIAVAPDLFWRDAPGLDLNSWSEEEWRRGLELYQAYDRDKGVSDIAATIASARKIEGGTGKVGVTGFCLGGLMTFLVAARTDVDAAASYYGGGTDQYLDEADTVTAPLIIHLGDRDEFIPKEAQARIVDVFMGRTNAEVYSYPGCSHAFARHTGDHYDANAATVANQRTRAFLHASLDI